ncbi:UDP-N-acetylmuramoyl-L-alanyl-D-glutamate synthetase [Corynebacterium frankenforstense DSM 45800]|uniref:UDP-N-acetylmuramoylalanine--D-glutamate ligase n=1 Tax=Corynebacterium frankenforstense DSM 45800 TaxID=1437875 RepID=A0A1L7CTN9_9CORY|nr:UDP-N-acetylmuramoyl-L-alanine--D-glutamate ligase [Corynebacterium frankenforstense]APT89223.1 UDP-N-acetylmuramoyl-L-alanyl-D-glutamate synthetase [Corynebacterium frankenforstense DSM 45800]
MLPRHVLVAGAGVSGAGAARLLAGIGVAVTVADDNAAARERLLASIADVAPGDGRAQVRACALDEARDRFAEFDLVVTSPGWRPDSPLLVAAAEAGLDVIGDVEMAWRLDRAGHFGAPRRWLAVTGTNGKTTTTGMLAACMQAAGERAVAVGNIGVAVADALDGEERVDVLVAELSSFQLHWAPTLTPDAGVLLNLADDHLDWHGSFAAYAAAKARVLRGPVAVAGVDDAHVRELLAGDAGASSADASPAAPADAVSDAPAADAGDAPRRFIGFTLAAPEPGQVGVVDGRIVDHTGAEPVDIAPTEGIDPPGPAGVLDALAATAVARSQGVAPAAIAEALAGFHVARHRGQTVLVADDVRWVDNSKATNPHAAVAALKGVDRVVWIAGGQLKGAHVDDMVAALAPHLDAAVLLGVDRAILAEALARLAPQVPVETVATTDPEAAMTEVCRAAARHARRGGTVALAPAAASLDMYTGMGQRGDLFAAAARQVTGKDGPR